MTQALTRAFDLIGRCADESRQRTQDRPARLIRGLRCDKTASSQQTSSPCNKKPETGDRQAGKQAKDGRPRKGQNASEKQTTSQ